MAKRIRLTRKDKFLDRVLFTQLLDDFINDSYSGRRTKKNGARIARGTIRNYENMKRVLLDFVDERDFEIRIYVYSNLTQREREKAKLYYQKFYRSFTNYMYNKNGYFDNYVGQIIKSLRTFFNYLRGDRSIDVGEWHKNFYAPSEEIAIITLTPEHMRYIINDEEFILRAEEAGLSEIRDIFIFGCTVGLRISDLMSLTKKNLVIAGGNYYLNVKSQKTSTTTSIKLPPYAKEIIRKYQRKQRNKYLLPHRSSYYVNSKLKLLGALLPDNFEIVKTRERRGKQVVVYKDSQTKTHYKLSDHITAHTMRRTAITNLLSLGMPEHMVRKISGHAANSKEFFRYVELTQKYLDEETDKIFETMMEY